jgi:hypothetical protein
MDSQEERLSSDERLTVWRGFPMRPMSWRHAEPETQWTVQVKNESSELPFEIGLHVQQLKAQHLRLERDGM